MERGLPQISPDPYTYWKDLPQVKLQTIIEKWWDLRKVYDIALTRALLERREKVPL
jgi:hypothetical protein